MWRGWRCSCEVRFCGRVLALELGRATLLVPRHQTRRRGSPGYLYCAATKRVHSRTYRSGRQAHARSFAAARAAVATGASGLIDTRQVFAMSTWKCGSSSFIFTHLPDFFFFFFLTHEVTPSVTVPTLRGQAATVATRLTTLSRLLSPCVAVY